MRHLGLFSGIGGFALACEWAGIETISFVEIDKFCQKVLKKHWPLVPIVEDINNVKEIKQIITNCECVGWQTRPRERIQSAEQIAERQNTRNIDTERLLLTGGFPCQPFSNAGQKRGSSDDRYLWPQTLAVIESVKPDWIILENVPGILNMVFPDSGTPMASQASLFCDTNETIADFRTISGGIERDLRQAGYETVWLVIPACSLSAPHRRDRVWIVANSKHSSDRTIRKQISETDRVQRISRSSLVSRMFAGTDINVTNTNNERLQRLKQRDTSKQEFRSLKPYESITQYNQDDSNSTREGLSGDNTEGKICSTGCSTKLDRIPRWSENWYEVATKFCRVDDGISNRVDKPKHRVERLKALGNAIVPQVAYQLIKTIKECEIIK